ncbi:protein mono-ADP-ribosyltransferase PARP14-like isoform X2 [Pelmatolapia mariae]|uniref:protein mono-ADP-ribosyltransferase PARP14-like isoform X2 n=1 Tax=Pelmatolapia mariae TaxID=158779 RepID=UPI002FE5467A
MEGSECPPVTVEGDWTPAQTKALKNKLQIYFQSKKKSSGGDCRVEAEEGAPRAAVYFSSPEVRERVLARKNHEIILDSKTIQLRLSSEASPTSSNDVSDSSSDSKKPQAEPGNGAAAASKEDSESSQSCAVVLENVTDNMSTDLLSMLVENISGLDENSYSMESIWESNSTVVTFKSPADVERFLSVSQTSTKMKKQGLTARPLEAATNIRVESLPPTVVEDMLELYFEKTWTLPDKIRMIRTEQAAIITFGDPKVVEKICVKKDLEMKSITVKVYPYYESLGTALYGKERPTWKMPEPFTEPVHHVIWKFLVEKKLSEHINDQMRPHFCRVDLNDPEVKLSPVPEFLRQQDLTAEHVDNWMNKAQEAFRRLMSQYTAFECKANAQGWTAAEKDVRSVVKEDAILVLDASKGVLTVAGRADDIKRIRAPVENILLKAMSHIERQTNSVSEEMILSPAWFYILKQEGLQKAALDISPEMKLSYDEGTQKLTITGLPAEVFKTKSWILERNVNMSKKHQNVPPCLLDFLRTLDPMDLSQDLFTSQGISAIYTIDNKGLLLLGCSDRILADAESKMKAALAHQIVNVEDHEVLKLPTWVDLKQNLLDTYNLSRKKTVAIEMHPERKITVAGFVNPVKEVSHSLRVFIENYSRVQETIRVQSCAAVQFIERKRTEEWSSIAKDNDVSVRFYVQKQSISILGARLHVQKAKSCFMELASALFTDTLTVDKPGAKKYFQTQGSIFLSTIMNELRCVILLRPEIEDEEEEENYGGESTLCYCKVQTIRGVLISVSKVDICSFGVDAVVNAANEDLDHIGGLALALLKAAGPLLQRESSDYVAKNGRLRPGDAIITDAYNLPCKHVVHAVGPRFSDFDRKTAVSRLKTAVRESLRQAEMANCSSIALPAISSGIFGFPVDLCAETIAQAVREYCDSPQGLRSLTEIHLVDNNDSTGRVMATAVSKEFSDLGPTMTISQQAGGKRTGASGGSHQGRGKQGHSQSHGTSWSEAKGRGGEGEHRGNHQGNRGSRSPKQHTWHGEHGGLEQTTAEGMKIILSRGNIQDQTTDVIVNTISEDMNLSLGAVSNAILSAAGESLQDAIYSEARRNTQRHGEVVVTDGYNLTCQKVFHAVCPSWDKGGGQAEEELTSIIRYCLVEAEKRQMASLSFPAIGTGHLSFPRALVSKLLLREIRSYSSSRNPRCLREVVIVVHPSDSQTVDCFTSEFTGQRNVQRERHDFNELPVQQPVSQSQHSSASFGPVLSTSLGVYQMQMGRLTLEVSSGDITKETSDVIVNSSNQTFDLKAGVSKAILDGAGITVEQECARIVSSTGQSSAMILTSAGQLPSRNIIHVVGQNNPANIKNMVYSVLKFCEENNLISVAFPALGTGQGGASPSAVADAMVDAVVEFVRKKQPRFVQSVKILIFQTAMLNHFHVSMKKRQGETVEEKSVFGKIKATVRQFMSGLVSGSDQSSSVDLVLEREEFEPTVFQLCADDNKALSQAKKRINDLIVAEQAQKTISDPFISQLSQADMEELKALQRKLTVSIRLDKGAEDQDPAIHLEGLTRDVFTAESALRDIIRKVERAENSKRQALLVSSLVEWQFPDRSGSMVPFDIYTNFKLEEALEKKQKVKIKINNETYTADPGLRKAVSANRRNLELIRKEVKDDTALPLPSCWEDMKGDLVKLFALTPGSQEYSDVEQELTKTGLNLNIISIERVQNPTLWQNYQILKKQMETKNKHKNNEKLLFHGTRAKSVDLINDKGFNRSYAGTNGAAIGKGSYFAVNPNYSAQGYASPDAKGHKRMYQAKVLVGDYTQGQQGMITPPAKSGSASDLYDSVTDNMSNPSMFVVFNDIQAYPEYLITFT